MRWHGKWYGYDGGRKQQEETIQISFLYPLDLTYTHITHTHTHTDLYSHILLLLLYFFINEFNNPLTTPQYNHKIHQSAPCYSHAK